MFSFSRKTDLALLIVTALARRRGSRYVSLRNLAREHRLPYRFASQVIGLLAQADIVEAKEGVHGGYRLAKRPEALTVADVLRATEGETALVACLDPRRNFACPQKAWCTAKEGMGLLQRQLLDSLRSTTLADFIRAHAHAER